MKIKTTVLELTHDDLVELFSTALYGSEWLGTIYDSIEYNSLPDKNDNDCLEDKLARLLLAGKTIEICDYYAEDSADRYGALDARWDDERECMCYNVSLNDILNGLNNAANTKAFYRYVHSDEDGQFDNIDAEELVQYILFEEGIYG